MVNKPERRSPLIDWLMGVEQNSVNLSIILVVSCVGLSDCKELVGVTKGDDWFGLEESNIYHQLVDLNRKVVIK